MKLSCLCQGIDIAETNLESLDIEVSSVCGDSRRAEENDVFISIRGNSYNGHKYIGEALRRRAAVIVIDDKRYAGQFPYIRVACARKAYSCMWNNLCGRPSERMKYIAVTGTNGKSSVVMMLSHILNFSGIPSEVIGTLNSSLTTPDPPELYPRLAQYADGGCRYAVIEASSHALEYRKLSPLNIDIGIFTNLTGEHLDFHGNMRAYADAKARLFSGCGTAIYNYDDKYGKYITRRARRRYSYSFCDDRADYVCKNIRQATGRGEFDFLTVGELFRVRIPHTGRFAVYNAMAACSAAYRLGVPKEQIREAVAVMPVIPGRLEEVYLEGADFRVFIDYAHTPDALSKLLSTLRETVAAEGRLICVFGCGGNRDRSKRAPMGNIATTLADRVIITSDNSRNESLFDIIRDILCGVDKTKCYTVIPDRRSAIRYTVHSARTGDVIVFCGKGHEDYEITSIGKIPFIEKDIIEEAYKERIGIDRNEHNSC